MVVLCSQSLTERGEEGGGRWWGLEGEKGWGQEGREVGGEGGDDGCWRGTMVERCFNFFLLKIEGLKPN